MSLLLDALKKSGTGTDSKNSPDNLSELSLEALPEKRTQNSETGQPHALGNNTTPRSAGENLFAAKKTPARPKFQYNLGIVPTAIIIGLILATAGSIYVWYEIQPPKHAQYRPAPATSTMPAPPPAQAARPLPSLAIADEPAPPAESHATVSKPAPVVEHHAPAPASRKSRAAPPPAEGFQIQRKSDTDAIYTTVMAAYQAYENGDLATAWQHYREVLIKDSKNRDALLGMAAIAQQQKQDDIAKQYYNRVLSLDPRDPVALAGMSAYSTSDVASRESKLKYSLTQSPNSPALFFALGNLYTEQSRWSEAQEAYFNAFKLEPANAQFAFSLATSLDHLGQGKIAAQYYRQALQLDTRGNPGFDRAQTEKRLNQLTSP